MKTDLWWAAPFLDSWDWIKRRQAAEHAHAFLVCSGWLDVMWPAPSDSCFCDFSAVMDYNLELRTRKSFLPELLLTGHFIIAAEKKMKTAFLPLSRFSFMLSSAAAKQNSVTTDKNPSASLPQSSRHKPSMVFLYVAAQMSSSAMSVLATLVFYLLRWLWACPLTPVKHCIHSLCLPGYLNYFFTSCKYPPIPFSLWSLSWIHHLNSNPLQLPPALPCWLGHSREFLAILSYSPGSGLDSPRPCAQLILFSHVSTNHIVTLDSINSFVLGPAASTILIINVSSQ